jgi:hypothetical protein
MSEGRYIETDRLKRLVREVLREARSAPDLSDQETYERAYARVDRFLANRGRVPDLVTPTAAAEILGMRVEHLPRLRDREEMPEAYTAASKGRDVTLYLRSDIETLRDRRAEQRAAAAEQLAEQAAARERETPQLPAPAEQVAA